MRLQMNGPGVGRCGNVIHPSRIFRIAHVDDRKTLGEHVTNVSKATMHHDLHAVRRPALIGVANDAHVACMIRLGQVAHLYASRKFGTAIQSSMAPSLCSSSCMRRSSSVLRLTPRWQPSLRPCNTIVLPIGCRSAL